MYTLIMILHDASLQKVDGDLRITSCMCQTQSQAQGIFKPFTHYLLVQRIDSKSVHVS